MIVLLGGIGSGKSTFLHRFFKVVVADHQNHLWFYIDFRNAPLDDSEIETFVINKMFDIWENKYKDNFSQILSSISFYADYSDKKTFLQKFIALQSYLRFSTTLVIDNVDQHELHFQEKIFLTAHHLKDVFNTLAIIALREETFVSSTRTGVFDAFYIQKFHISSPNFLRMVLKRLQFTIKLVKSENSEIPKENIIQYLEIIESSLRRKNKQSQKLVEFIDRISVGNMREALRMFNNFIISGNTNIKDIFSKHAQSGEYQISYHQFIKSIILGEYRYYSQERSHLMNVFDFDPSITDSCFNLLKILNYLQYRSNKRSSIGRGYVLIDELINIFEGVSTKRNVVIDSLLRLSNFNLVEYDNQSRTDIKKASYVKITAAGNYYLNSLIFEFTYIDVVSFDTPISDEKVVKEMKKMLNAHTIETRIERAGYFISYLVEMETKEHANHPEYLHNELTNKMFANDIQKYFNEFQKRIKK